MIGVNCSAGLVSFVGIEVTLMVGMAFASTVLGSVGSLAFGMVSGVVDVVVVETGIAGSLAFGVVLRLENLEVGVTFRPASYSRRGGIG